MTHLRKLLGTRPMFSWVTIALMTPTATLAQSLADFIGCYSVRTGAWSDPVRHARIFPGDSVPAAIRLRPESGAGLFGQDGYVLDPRPTDVFGVFGDAGGAWWTAEADSVRLIWTTGHAGIVARAELQNDRLTGFIESFWDNRDGVPDPRASFEAARVDCG
jgi:hypothetical protein